MLTKKLWYNLSIMTIISSGLFGCAQMQKTDAIAQSNIDKANKIADQINQYDPSLISYNDNIYVSDKSFKRVKHKSKLPDIFNEKITFNTSEAMTIQSIIKLIGSQTNIPVRLTADAYGFLSSESSHKKKQNVNADSASSVQPVIVMQDGNSGNDKDNKQSLLDIKTTLYYSGSVKKLLSLLAANYGLWWKYDATNQTVNFYYYETKTFMLDMLVGSTTTKTTIDSNSNAVQGAQNTKTTYDSEDNKPWDSAIDTIKSFIGKDGHIESSPKNGYITVVATPLLMQKVDRYIASLNETSRKRIAVRIDVYDVQQTNSQNYGFNWDAMYKVTSGALKWNTTSLPTALTDAFNSSIQTATISGGITSGPFAGSTAIVNALSQLGKTSKITGTTVYTVNGRSVPIQVSRSTAYIKEISVNTLGGSSSSSGNVQKSATPGTVNTGYSITVTPKIIADNEVMVNLSVNIASLLGMENAKIDDQGSYMQLPDVRNKSFMQAVPLTSGQTAVLAGFQNSEDTSGQNSVIPGTVIAGGNNAANHDHTVTVVIVTPYIIGK